jgi:hypothetical protein
MKLLLLALVAFLAGPSLFGAPVKPQPSLRPEPFTQEGSAWDGPQFVRADRKGHVFLFRGLKFEVYPVADNGSLGEPLRLERTAAASNLVQDAVLSPAGDQWLVYADLGVRLFENKKEKPVPPLPWRLWSIAFLGGVPVAAVLPVQVGDQGFVLEDLSSVPWLLSLGNGRWEPAVNHARLSGKALAEDSRDMNGFVEDYAVFLASDREGKLWAARQYAYRVERWSPSGRPLLTIVVDGGKVAQKKKVPESPEASAAVKRDQAQGRASRFAAFSARASLRDLAEGRDHRMYFLVSNSESGDLALDRYDPVRSVLERAPLALKKSGRFTMAAGKNGLYLAAWNGREGRWWLSWEALDQADWREVEGAEIDAGQARSN